METVGKDASLLNAVYEKAMEVNKRIEAELERFISSNAKLVKNRNKFFTNVKVERRNIGLVNYQDVYSWGRKVILVVTFKDGNVTLATYF